MYSAHQEPTILRCRRLPARKNNVGKYGQQSLPSKQHPTQHRSMSVRLPVLAVGCGDRAATTDEAIRPCKHGLHKLGRLAVPIRTDVYQQHSQHSTDRRPGPVTKQNCKAVVPLPTVSWCGGSTAACQGYTPWHPFLDTGQAHIMRTTQCLRETFTPVIRDVGQRVCANSQASESTGGLVQKAIS